MYNRRPQNVLVSLLKTYYFIYTNHKYIIGAFAFHDQNIKI